jgi:lipoprotein-anchoring transpeptidase ErfK/SrfK
VTNAELWPPAPTASPAKLDPRCTVGRVVCIDKRTRSVRWVIDGVVQYRLDARFGSEFTPTREGRFAIEWKDRDHVSKQYGSRMPFSMFFSGGQAIHYSSDFANKGYAGASHGCVNTRNWSMTERLYSDSRIGDAVVVYRS